MKSPLIRSSAVLLSGVCAWLATAAAGPALAAPGDLDRAFGAAGRVEESFGGAFPGSEKVVSSAALQGDSKIVVAGSTSAQGGRLVLARFRTDGSPDPAFGDRGLANLPLRVRTGDVLIQPDGKIVTAGTGADRRFALTRHNSDGSLDRTFGDGGRVETQLGDSSGASAVVLQEDGKLVAAGWSYDDEVPSFALARYNADGSLDPTFGAAGKVRTPWPGWYGAGASDLVRDPNARLVAAGGVNSGHKGWSYFALARYTANGALDPSFGSGGTVRGPEGGASTLLGRPNGSLIAGGAGGLVGYRADGSLDPGFGRGGQAPEVKEPRCTVPCGGVPVDLGRQAGGRLLVAGHRHDGRHFILARLLQDGSRDRGFGRDGLVITAFGRLYRPYPHAGSSRAAFPSSLVLQRDGKVVIVGSSANSPESFGRPECCPPPAIAMARYFTGPLGRVTWAPRRPRRESVVRRGLAFGLRCVERCDVRAELRLDRATARRLQIPPLVARSSGRLSAGGTRTLVLRLGSRARRALSRPGTAGAELRVTFSGAPEHPDVSRVRVSLR